jgi:UDP-N-acetylmuramate dehydrogenase
MIEYNKDLTAYHTFGTHTLAAAFASFGSHEQLAHILSDKAAAPFRNQLLVLGGGSNLLFTHHFNGLVIRNEIPGITLVAEDEHAFFVKVGGGVVWHQFVMHCIEQGWAGVENLALIPGCVGASPIQNIGAYGVEIKDVFHELEAFHLHDLALQTFTHQQCHFGYRDSVFKNEKKGQFAIISVTFRLHKKAVLHTSYGAIESELNNMHISHPGIADVAQAVIRIRQSKLPDPAVVGNAGSFFKNPVIATTQYRLLKQTFAHMPGYDNGPNQTKIPAAWLIEQCGLKGFRKGDAGIHHLQPLVLVNLGKASGMQIFELSCEVIEKVHQRFGIPLEREVNIL